MGLVGRVGNGEEIDVCSHPQVPSLPDFKVEKPKTIPSNIQKVFDLLLGELRRLGMTKKLAKPGICGNYQRWGLVWSPREWGEDEG